jgi:hypothetical protein
MSLFRLAEGTLSMGRTSVRSLEKPGPSALRSRIVSTGKEARRRKKEVVVRRLLIVPAVWAAWASVDYWLVMGRWPNTRMQRTRSSPSALRSPLMRYPLGAMWQEALR